MASSSSSLLLLLLLLPFTAPSPIKLSLTPTTIHPSPSDPLKTLNHLASLSISRAHHLKSSKSKIPPINTPLYSRSYGGYSISLNFGTPPQTVNLILDTGSSLVWFPCTSNYLCSGCNFPNSDVSNTPKFIPKSSSSSKVIGCQNPKCAWVFGSNIESQCHNCDSRSQNCTQACPPYIIQYGLGSTAGRLLSESLDFPNVTTIPNFLVGCSLFSTRQPEGIAGFGRSSESLPRQLSLKKFSHCLISRRFDDTPVSSELVLDRDSNSGDTKTKGVSYTPFLTNPGTNLVFQDYYYLMLRKIIVGDIDVKVPYSFLAPGADGNSGTIVDSGSTFTFMEEPVFELVAKAFEKQMRNYSIAIDVQNQTGLRPCFDISGEKSVIVPELIFHFKGGAKMELPLSNYFAFLDVGVVCLTIVSNTPAAAGGSRGGGPAIILGNFQQQNFYVEYDLENNRFGFKKQNCA